MIAPSMKSGIPSILKTILAEKGSSSTLNSLMIFQTHPTVENVIMLTNNRSVKVKPGYLFIFFSFLPVDFLNLP
jgi:hypothetical protein